MIKALEPLADGRNIVMLHVESVADTVKLHVVAYAGSLPLHHFMEHT